MATFPETGIEYYTYQFSAADEKTLNDASTIKQVFEGFNGPNQEFVAYPFHGQGITAIGISPEGTVTTAHTWPHQSENQFGIVTEYQGSSLHRMNARRLIETFRPGPVRLDHTPRLNHAVAIFETPDTHLLDPSNLTLYLDQFVRNSGLNGIPTHMIARELPTYDTRDQDPPIHFKNPLKTTIAGEVLTNSSIVMVAENIVDSPDLMRIMIDCMTCEERNMDWLPGKILERYSVRRLHFASQDFGPQTLDDGEIVSARTDKHSQVFMRKFLI
jgi:hypothetical protein